MEINKYSASREIACVRDKVKYLESAICLRLHSPASNSTDATCPSNDEATGQHFTIFLFLSFVLLFLAFFWFIFFFISSFSQLCKRIILVLVFSFCLYGKFDRYMVDWNIFMLSWKVDVLKSLFIFLFLWLAKLSCIL